MVHYYITLRKVSGGQFTNEVDLGAVRYLRVPDGRLPNPSDAIARTQWVREVIASFPLRDHDGKQIPTGDLAFFVHGFNNTVASVSARQAQLQAGINQDGYACEVVSFDWPSEGTTIAYLADLDHVKKTAIQLVNAAILPFVQALQIDCDIRIHVIGHSMGAFLIREAFDHADTNSRAASATWTANQMVLLAGDASAAKFSKSNSETESLFRHCYRLTNYWSGYDAALQVSNLKRLGLAARVGRVGLPADAPDKGTNVDCSQHYLAQYGTGHDVSQTHSWYFTDATFLKDLRLTLQGAIDRFKLPTRITLADRTQHLID